MIDKKIKDCPNIAKFQYAWGGNIIKACEQHTNAMSVISHVIGGIMDIQRISGEHKCEHNDDLKEENEN